MTIYPRRPCSSGPATRTEWRKGVLYIGGQPAKAIAQQAIAEGLIQPKRPRHWKPPEQRAKYAQERRRKQTECMRRLRAQRRAQAKPAPKTPPVERGIVRILRALTRQKNLVRKNLLPA